MGVFFLLMKRYLYSKILLFEEKKNVFFSSPLQPILAELSIIARNQNFTEYVKSTPIVLFLGTNIRPVLSRKGGKTTNISFLSTLWYSFKSGARNRVGGGAVK